MASSTAKRPRRASLSSPRTRHRSRAAMSSFESSPMRELLPVLCVLLGWLFGFVTAVYSEDLRLKRRAPAIRAAIEGELRELQLRMVMTSVGVAFDTGSASRPFLEWAAKQLAHGSSTNNPYAEIAAS